MFVAGRSFAAAPAHCGAPGAVAGAPATIPFKREPASAGAVGASALGVLLVLLAAVGAVLYLRKRLNLGVPGAGGQRLVRVLESERMGPRALLSVVEFGGQRYLLAQGEHGISCVASVPAPADAREPS
jgi:flagellar biogenesis protein FliO